MPTDYEIGLLVGLLIGEGHFGGDGRQPQVTLRMHVRHEPLFRWLERTFPGGRLYGPYSHDGRNYYQWMARGRYLRDELIPLLAGRLAPDLDAHSFARFETMRRRYQPTAGEQSRVTSGVSPPSASAPQRQPAPGPDGADAAAGVFQQLQAAARPPDQPPLANTASGLGAGPPPDPATPASAAERPLSAPAPRPDEDR
jgi:hypothetical protein